MRQSTLDKAKRLTREINQATTREKALQLIKTEFSVVQISSLEDFSDTIHEGLIQNFATYGIVVLVYKGSLDEQIVNAISKVTDLKRKFKRL